MSVVIPSAWSLPALQDYTTGEEITARKVQDVFEAGQKTWSRRGARITGLYYPSASGWETDSTTYTAVNSVAGGEDLTTWLGLARLDRPHFSLGELFEGLTMQVFGRRLDLRCSVISVDTDTTLLTLESLGGAGWQWSEDTASIPEEDTFEGADEANPRRLLRFELEARTNTPAQIATLRAWSIDHWQGMTGDNVPKGYL